VPISSGNPEKYDDFELSEPSIAEAEIRVLFFFRRVKKMKKNSTSLLTPYIQY
jgi:hypothetical protein